jgi:hypothetical protein
MDDEAFWTPLDGGGGSLWKDEEREPAEKCRECSGFCRKLGLVDFLVLLVSDCDRASEDRWSSIFRDEEEEGIELVVDPEQFIVYTGSIEKVVSS